MVIHDGILSPSSWAGLRFGVTSAKDYADTDYALAAVVDCLHGRGDPIGASLPMKSNFKPDGSWMIVAPFACLQDKLNPVSRAGVFSSSTFICTPASRAQEAGCVRVPQTAGRGPHARRRHASWLPAFAARYPDTVQPGL